MALNESKKASSCPFCGISLTNFEFHINLHEDCNLMDGQSKQVGERIFVIVIDHFYCY